MKIALVSQLAYPINENFSGGLECFIYELAKELAKRDHEVTLFASGGSAVPGVKIIEVCKKGFLVDSNSSDQFIRKSLKEDSVYNYLLSKKLNSSYKDFDVIHFNTYSFLPLALAEADLIKNSVATMHVPPTSNFVKNLKEAIDPDSLKKIRFVGISDYQKENIEGLNFIGRIYDGADKRDFEFGDGKEGYYCWIGRIAPEKGLDVALSIAKKNDLELRFAGSIYDDKYYEQKIAPLVGGKIKYVGKVDKSSRMKFLSNARAMLLPLQWEEPFGIVFVEAMASGTPVVVFARGSVPEIIEDGKTGFIVNFSEDDKRGDWIIKESGSEGFDEAVKKINSLKEEEYAGMRQNCRKSFEQKFTIEKMVDQYEDLYKKVVE